MVTLQDRAVADHLLEGMDEHARMASWHLVTADGHVHSAGRGVPPLLALLPGGGPLARAAAAVQPVTDRAYRFVADHRTAFGRLIPEDARARADETLRRRS